MKKLIIFGTGDFAKLAKFYFENDSDYSISAFTVEKNFFKEDKFCDVPCYEFENIEKIFSPDEYEMFIAVGYTKINKVRAEIYQKAKEKGFKLANYISSKSIYWNNKIGDNCFIFEGCVIQPDAVIGNNNIIWSGSIISHDSIIGNNCFLAPGVTIAGFVKIENYCFLGAGCTIRNGIQIAQECIIGAGVTIINNIESGEVYKTPDPVLLNINSNEIKNF